jgi:hypothetical protein
MPDSPSVLLVGHCGPDSYALKSAVGRFLPGAAVEFVHDQPTLERKLPSADLVLINRVLDGGFASETALDVIAALAPGARARFLLISNYPEAQAAAVQAGALPGFGKAEMNAPTAKERLLAAMARPHPGS